MTGRMPVPQETDEENLCMLGFTFVTPNLRNVKLRIILPPPREEDRLA